MGDCRVPLEDVLSFQPSRVTLIPLSRSAPGCRIFAVRVPASQQEEVVALEELHKMGQGELLSSIKSDVFHWVSGARVLVTWERGWVRKHS